MQFINKSILSLALVPAFILFFGLSSASAQHGYRVTKQATFKKGQVATTVKGTIPNTLEGHEYIFRGRAGQTLLVTLLSTKKNISFFITTPSGETLGDETGLRNWTGELPETGEYHLFINTDSKGAAPYSCKIQIASDI
jgi:hypothetical protein